MHWNLGSYYSLTFWNTNTSTYTIPVLKLYVIFLQKGDIYKFFTDKKKEQWTKCFQYFYGKKGKSDES